eukprot:c15597_g1_i1.p1 GENE.c15597_g1_i1~~c15597_g1_i1.p1  ORF type:complete len:655 (-),score=129.33 c15597_g1_i1:9-1949(-)
MAAEFGSDPEAVKQAVESIIALNQTPEQKTALCSSGPDAFLFTAATLCRSSTSPATVGPVAMLLRHICSGENAQFRTSAVINSGLFESVIAPYLGRKFYEDPAANAEFQTNLCFASWDISFHHKDVFFQHPASIRAIMTLQQESDASDIGLAANAVMNNLTHGTDAQNDTLRELGVLDVLWNVLTSDQANDSTLSRACFTLQRLMFCADTSFADRLFSPSHLQRSDKTGLMILSDLLRNRSGEVHTAVLESLDKLILQVNSQQRSDWLIDSPMISALAAVFLASPDQSIVRKGLDLIITVHAHTSQPQALYKALNWDSIFQLTHKAEVRAVAVDGLVSLLTPGSCRQVVKLTTICDHVRTTLHILVRGPTPNNNPETGASIRGVLELVWRLMLYGGAATELILGKSLTQKASLADLIEVAVSGTSFVSMLITCAHQSSPAASTLALQCLQFCAASANISVCTVLHLGGASSLQIQNSQHDTLCDAIRQSIEAGLGDEMKTAETALRLLTEKFQENNLPMCPISHGVMIDPVITEVGSTYDRASIESFFKSSPEATKDPLTNRPLAHFNLIPNRLAKEAVCNCVDVVVKNLRATPLRLKQGKVEGRATALKLTKRDGAIVLLMLLLTRFPFWATIICTLVFLHQLKG